MRIAIFGGSFDPVHLEHVRMVKAAIKALALDRVFVVPSFVAPHKPGGAGVSAERRLAMCRIAFNGVKNVEVSDLEMKAGGTSYTYLTCRKFAEDHPDAERFFLMGADMLENFYTWKNPQDIVAHATLAVCGRGEGLGAETHTRFIAEFHTDYREVDFVGREISSTAVRAEIAFGMKPKAVSGAVYRYIKKHALYAYSAIPKALKLEKPKRRKHSLRVAKLACARARSLGIEEGRALLAAALHDCGKYVPIGSPLLLDFDAPFGVPAPVMHQFTGAYLAEHEFGISDGEVLNAIRFHTSGRAGMTKLEILIYLADLLESERDFTGIEKLRELFWRDIEECLLDSLALQIGYLRTAQKPIYSLTEEAYEWIKSKKQADF